MISYLVDAVLLIALAFTSMRVTRMHRELARLRKHLRRVENGRVMRLLRLLKR